MNKEKKGFRSMKDWDTGDYGKSAITGLLGGAIISLEHYIIFEILGGIIFLAGFLCGLVWIARKLQRKPRNHEN